MEFFGRGGRKKEKRVGGGLGDAMGDMRIGKKNIMGTLQEERKLKKLFTALSKRIN